MIRDQQKCIKRMIMNSRLMLFGGGGGDFDKLDAFNVLRGNLAKSPLLIHPVILQKRKLRLGEAKKLIPGPQAGKC